MKKAVLILCLAIMLTACGIPGVNEIGSSESSTSASTTAEVEDVFGTVVEAKTKTTTIPETTAPPEPEVSKISDDELNAIDNTEIGYGQGVQFDANNCPSGATNFNAQYDQYDSYAVLDSDKEIYLTFDQGYENGYTGQILDTLKEKNVKAIFFLTGGYVRNTDPALIQRMIDEGHVLGNHGDNHKSLANLLTSSIEDAEAELDGCEQLVKEKFGYDMKYMRPPEGKFSERSLALAHRMGYTTFLWSFAYKDWEVNNQPLEEESFVKITAHPHSGELMLLHAVSKTNADILPRIIENLQDQGFTLTTPSI